MNRTGRNPASRSDAGVVVRRLPWMRSLSFIRKFCCLWLAVIGWLIFHPMPTRAQPETTHAATTHTAMRPIPEDESTEDVPLPTGVGNSRNLEKPPPKLLVLKNGRIVDGRISQNAGGYLVEMPNGSLIIPFDRVNFEAQDTREAYRKMRSSLPRDATASNLAMARWCISYNLFDEAESELREALHKTPNNEEARSILERLEELRNPSKPLHRQVEKPSRKTDDGFELPEVESLGGFSRSTVQEFVSKVQPVLWNKCGNASCHGGTQAKSGFSLSPVRGNWGNRVLAERNLAAVMKEIDPEAPDRSRLLTTPRGSHGGSKTIFSGAKGGEQFELIRDWVQSAANEMQENGLSQAAKPRVASTSSSRIRPASASVLADQVETGMTSRSTRADNKVNRAVFQDAAAPDADSEMNSKDPLRKTLRESQPDAFDPDEFNRREPQP